MTSSGGGSTPSASAGAVSVSRLIHRIWVASSGTATASPVSSSPMHAGEHDAEEHRQHLADVRREQEAQELADVGEDAAPLADRGDDRGEVVVGEDHVRRLLRHVGAGDAHRDADVGRLQRRRVVDAVAGHGDDVARRPGARRRSAACAPARRGRRPTVVAHASPQPSSSSGSSSAPVSASVRPARRCRGRRRCAPAVRGWSPVIMITRTPAAARLGDRRPRLRARRVDDADHPEVDELAARRDSSSARSLVAGQRAVGDRQRAQRDGRRAGRRWRGSRCGARRRAAAAAPAHAARAVHRASSTSGAPLVTTAMPRLALASTLQRAHQLALRGERDLADALEPRPARLGQARDLAPRRRGTPPRWDRPGSIHSPSSSRSTASLARLPADEHGADLVEQRPARRAGGRRRAARPRAGSRCR